MRSTLSLLAALAFCAAIPAAAATPGALGRWRTATDAGVVEISPCPTGLCGRLVTSNKIAREPGLADNHNSDPKLRARPLKGLMLLYGFGGGPAAWSGGRIYNPDDGATYDARMTLLGPDVLEVKGCALVVFCKAQTWRRVKGAP